MALWQILIKHCFSSSTTYMHTLKKKMQQFACKWAGMEGVTL